MPVRCYVKPQSEEIFAPRYVSRPATIGQRIAQARRELAVRRGEDVTPSDLAGMASVSPATVYRWEDGTKKPSEGSLDALSAVLGVTKAYLRYGTLPKELDDGPVQSEPLDDPLPDTDEHEIEPPSSRRVARVAEPGTTPRPRKAGGQRRRGAS